ncbi:MAG: hypothetical protein OSJ27_04585 [Candidatus Gastranaerophilales bacterium]|nr:hypothetical protein [Candidatus Gastranaerophilales bacterium]
MDLLALLVLIYLCGSNKITGDCGCFPLIAIISVSIIITFLFENKILLCIFIAMILFTIIVSLFDYKDEPKKENKKDNEWQYFLFKHKKKLKINTPEERKKQEQLLKLENGAAVTGVKLTPRGAGKRKIKKNEYFSLYKNALYKTIRFNKT